MNRGAYGTCTCNALIMLIWLKEHRKEFIIKELEGKVDVLHGKMCDHGIWAQACVLFVGILFLIFFVIFSEFGLESWCI